MIKDALLCKPAILCHILNNSLRGSLLPVSLKTGCVVPLPKTGSLKDVSNWRPISLLHIFSKLIERIVHKQLMTYLISNGLVSEMQFGFLPGRSTSDATFGLIQSLFEARNRSELSVIVFLDLKKAFDTMGPLTLLPSKLLLYALVDT